MLRQPSDTHILATDFESGIKHIDVWTGSPTVNGGQDQIDCENSLTPDAQSIVRQPRDDLPVDCKPLTLLSIHPNPIYIFASS